jgi:hypothetical protein
MYKRIAVLADKLVEGPQRFALAAISVKAPSLLARQRAPSRRSYRADDVVRDPPMDLYGSGGTAPGGWFWWAVGCLSKITSDTLVKPTWASIGADMVEA